MLPEVGSNLEKSTVGKIPLLLLGLLLNPQQLMRPQSLKSFRPLIQWTDCLSVRPIHHVPSIPPNAHQSHLTQHFQVLRHGRLLQPHSHHEVANWKLCGRQMLQNLASPRLGYSVKRIRCSRGPCHKVNIFLYRHMSSENISREECQSEFKKRLILRSALHTPA